MKKCPTCKKRNAVIHPTYGVVSCQVCKESQETTFTRPDVVSLSRLHRVQEQRDKHIKDMLQPYQGKNINPDFFKAYPDKVDKYSARRELEKV